MLAVTNFVLNLVELLSKLTQTLMSVAKVIIQSRKAGILPKRQHDACCILANGPSLKLTLETSDIDFLADKELVAVNNFAISPFFKQLRPANYVIHDLAFYFYDGVHFKNQDVEKTLQALKTDIDWPIYLYVQQKARQSPYFRDLVLANKNIKLVYYNTAIFEGFDSIKHWFFRSHLATPQTQNVLVMALFLSIKRHFKQIYLFGADHSWHEQLKLGQQGLEVKDHHFYDTKDKGYVPIFDPQKQEMSTMSKQFISLAKAFRGYEVLRDFARAEQVQVLNASKKTFIDAFPIVKI
jgi:hypothetical protein